MKDSQLWTPDGRPRARALRLPLLGQPGPWNAITDVPGVEVGYVTLRHGAGRLCVGRGPVRTGVTSIHPRGRVEAGSACAAGWSSLNGNGEMTGTTWISETGAFSSPIVLSNTHAVGACHRGVIDWMVLRQPSQTERWLLPVVAETWDGYLNDVNGDHVGYDHVVRALDEACSVPLGEGSVGGGTGMSCYGFKGGSGTASRLVPYGTDTHTIGAFVQANFGGRRELVVAGVPVGRHMLNDNPLQEETHLPPGAGSAIVIVATDAPLLPLQCSALARRVPLGLARTGTAGSHFSGDIFLAFSVANREMLTSEPTESAPDAYYENLRYIPWGRMDDLYEAVVQVVEEAVLNALVTSETMVGRDDNCSPGIDLDRLRQLAGADPSDPG